jgi:integrase
VKGSRRSEHFQKGPEGWFEETGRRQAVFLYAAAGKEDPRTSPVGKTGAFFTLLGLSGLRASEILGLRVEDLDFDSSTIHIRHLARQVVTTKTEESGTSLPMTPALKGKLQAHLRQPHA